MIAPDPGKMRQVVTIQKRSATRDAYGQGNAWEAVVTDIPAAVVPVGGSERLRAMAISALITCRITVRYQAEFTDMLDLAAWRVLWGTRIFNISAAVNFDELNHWITLDCAEGGLEGGS